MKLEGGCYCGNLRYATEAEPLLKAQCHCRQCQYFTGGGPNLFMLIPAGGVGYTKGTPKTFARDDIKNPATREFCERCGTHLFTIPPGMGGAKVLKIGTLDDPKQFGQARMAIYTIDTQPFHHIADGLPAFERLPPRG
ncbi:MAG TPA: GFA family protein [Myxococcales bacterium]|jgi:hypothetical protein|nr:GFA family protein [Myxococcales bacterium]